MARIRTIKPEFFRHEELQGLGTDAMLVFAGLWTQCDSKGRFKWRPRQLKLDILPFIDFDMEGILGKLESSGFVTRYEVDGKKYGFIPTFRTHQRITGKEASDGEKYPEPIVTQPGNDGERQDVQEKEKEKEKELIIARPVPNPVDNSNGLKKELQGLVLKISEEYTPRQSREVQLFLELNHKRNPDAICHCLRRLIEEKARGSPPSAVGKWLEAVMRDEDKNYNAAESEQENNELKTATIPQDIKGLIDGIGKGGRK